MEPRDYRVVFVIQQKTPHKVVFSFYGAPEPVSEQKEINNCFLERCPTKQEVTRAKDLRRRSATTMRLGRSNLS